MVLEPEERKLYTLMQQLNTIRNAKAKLRAEQATRKRAVYEKKRGKQEALSAEHQKARRRFLHKGVLRQGLILRSVIAGGEEKTLQKRGSGRGSQEG